MTPKELVGEIAKRHHVILDENDPVLVLITLNELLLKEHLKSVAELLAESQNAANLNASQQLEAAKLNASKVVTNAGDYLTERIATAGKDAHKQLECTRKDYKEEVEKDIATIKTYCKLAFRSGILAAISAIGTILFVIAILYLIK